jgi:two-component system response regulator YesN
MYRVMVVDDEMWVRKGLIQLIPWNRMSLGLAAEAEDGEEAFEAALRQKPDIMLLDMRMPGWDGRTLLRMLHESLPGLITIVISGYSDFEYTKEAIRFQAFDYLLKPVKEHELNMVLEKAVSRLHQRKESESLERPVRLFNHDGHEGHFVVRDVVKTIERSYDEPLALHQVAEMRHMNADYLSRLFKKETGRNFVEYLTDYRIDKSKELIKNSNYKNYEIALKVGYEDYRYFSQVFKKKVGMTIGEYRRYILKHRYSEI